MGVLGPIPPSVDDKQAADIASLKRGERQIQQRAVRSGKADTVKAHGFVGPHDTTTNGFVVKANNASWGTGAYGTGQAFMFLREDYSGTPQGGGATIEPDRNVLFRVDRDGGIGTAGGIHVATGLRMNGRTAPTQGIWVQNFVAATGMVITAASNTPANDYVVYNTPNASVIFQHNAPSGSSGALRYNTACALGHEFRVGGGLYMTLGQVQAKFEVGLNLVELGGPGTVGNAAANRAFLYLEDNGAGKTQLCARFNTGARQVIATEP